MSAIEELREPAKVKPLSEKKKEAYAFLSKNDRIPPPEQLFYQVHDNRFAEGDVISALQQAEFQTGFPLNDIWLPRENERFNFPVEICIAKTHWLTNSYKSTFDDLARGISRIGGVCPHGALPYVLYKNPGFIRPQEEMIAVTSLEMGSMFLTARRDGGFGCTSIHFRYSIHSMYVQLPPDTVWMFAI